MLRYGPPYIGKRYLYNKNTNELHDLVNEKSECKIDQIKTQHIIMYDDKLNAEIEQAMNINSIKIDGCFYCMNQLHKN